MANLDIIIGPMFAGKSCELIKRIRLLKVLQKEYIVVKPKIDNRYDNNMVVSHNCDKEHCIILSQLVDIYKHLNNNINTIFIDEGQFFDDLKDNVINLVETHKINIIISGLDGDSNRNKFGQILDLIPYSTTCIKINAYCVVCMDGTYAPFTYRKQNKTNEQIQIGGNEEYMSVCREHYLDGLVKSL
jgi:thymidine kinase